MRQILGNLVSNAIRYARASDRFILSAGTAPDGAAVRGEDFGPGIPPPEPARLFEEFYRARGNGGAAG